MGMSHKRSSLMKNSLVLFSDPCSRALNPGFVVFWTGFEVFYSCFRLPIAPTTTFSTASVVFETSLGSYLQPISANSLVPFIANIDQRISQTLRGASIASAIR